MHLAAQEGNLEAAIVLIQHQAELDAVDVNNSTALHFAAHNGHLEIVKLLIEKGADMNIRTTKPPDWTPLTGQFLNLHYLLIVF